MGLLDGWLGNASEVDVASVGEALSASLVDGPSAVDGLGPVVTVQRAGT